MARILALSIANVRHLLLALLAIALVLRIGGGCEAMAAATPVAQPHCADMPAKPDKPVKSDIAACALCIAMPGAAYAKVGTATFVTIQPVAGLIGRLAGLAGGPAPPPPKIA